MHCIELNGACISLVYFHLYGEILKTFEIVVSYIFLPVDKLEPFSFFFFRFVLSDIHIYSIAPLPHIDILILAVCRIFAP